MSQENVEVVRKTIDGIRRGDWDAVAETLDPHILIRTDPSWPEQYIYGRDAAIVFYKGLAEALGAELEIEELVDLGDRVLGRFRVMVHARASGVEGEQRYTTINTYRAGRGVLVDFFLEHAQALKALCLEE